MYKRRITVTHQLASGKAVPSPVKWLDNFAMRNFTNDPIFDDTLPLGDGLMEVGARVPLDRLRDAMEDWFRRKNYLTKQDRLTVEETKPGGNRLA